MSATESSTSTQRQFPQDVRLALPGLIARGQGIRIGRPEGRGSTSTQTPVRSRSSASVMGYPKWSMRWQSQAGRLATSMTPSSSTIPPNDSWLPSPDSRPVRSTEPLLPQGAGSGRR